MRRDPSRSPLCALLSGLLLTACGGPTEAEVTPSQEPLGTQEAALCSGTSVTELTISGISSWGGEVAGSGTWKVASPANAVRLQYYLDGALNSESEAGGAGGTWYFSRQGVSCGSHTFEVRAYPMVIDSAGNRTVCWSSPSLSRSTTVVQDCPTASLSCGASSSSINCTGSGSGGSGGLAPFWQERIQYSDGSSYTYPWESGSWTWSVYCAAPLTRDEPTYRQYISFKVRDSSGMESTVRSYSRLCAY